VSDLGKRLEALLAEARERGELGELGDLLNAARAELAAASGASTADDQTDVPSRFGMVGDSEPLRAVFKLIERVASSSVPVLIRGETGTGKELVARALHDASPRRKATFLAENCAAVPANLLESELFGHKKGSFTHAIADRAGHFVAADKGTLFLDEIGDMPLEMQAKLLRVLETGEVRPVGSNETRKVDVRIVAATHRDLAQMVQERTFREDLFYRLDVVHIELPALRDRPGDVEHLVRFFLRRFADGVPRALDPEALAALVQYPWPGNVRQLENEMRRGCALSQGCIGLEDLSEEVRR